MVAVVAIESCGGLMSILNRLTMVAVFLLVAEVGFGIEGSPVGAVVKFEGTV